MAGNHKRRKRTIDIEKFTPDQATAMADQLGVEINKKMNDAYKECNKLLNIYGMELKMGYEIAPLSKKEKVNKKNDKSQSLK